MRIRGTVFTIVVLLSIIFAVVNWDVVTTELPIHLLFARPELPLGLILLAAILVLTAFYFFASLLDRARQLRQVTHLELHIDQLQEKLERKRLEELEGIERAFRERSDKLEGTIREERSLLDQSLSAKLAEQEMRTKERIAGVSERVVLVRDELAADVAAAEDSLRRLIEDEEDRESLPPA